MKDGNGATSAHAEAIGAAADAIEEMWGHHLRALAILAILLIAGGCATTGSTYRSGVGDSYHERAPFYAGVDYGSAGGLAHLPVAYQRGASQEAIFDPRGTPGTPIATLLAEMNVFLDSLMAAPALPVGDLGRATPPDVRFGCRIVDLGECEERDTGAFGASQPRMRLAVGRPSGSWVAAVAPHLDHAGADRVLLITLEVGEYWVYQKSLLGSKEVRLGTAHSARVPWLSSLDQPVQVLQLTGAIVDRQGQALRIGAEGLYARRTNLILSGFGAQELVTDSDVAKLRTTRREDLVDEPLLWQVALANLVGQLTGDRAVVIR